MGAGFGVKKTAVVLLNLGGPLSPEGVYPFLFSLFYDPLILTLPNPFRYLLAKLIARVRLPKARAIYAVLGGGRLLFLKTRKPRQWLWKRSWGRDIVSLWPCVMPRLFHVKQLRR